MKLLQQRSPFPTNQNTHYAPSTKMAEMCSNCNKEVDTKISSISTLAVSKIEEIRIWDVIAYVYRIGSISLDEFNIHFKKLNHHDLSINDLEEESLGMCDLCLSLLSDIYKVLKQFESLTHQASFIQHIQNTYKIKREKCTIEEHFYQTTNPDQTIISSSLSEKVNSDIFDSFNYEDDHPLDETDNYFTEEFKIETADDLFENESPSMLPRNSTPEVERISQKPVTEMSLKSSKQLVVKIEKLSEEDFEFYHGKRKKDCFNKVVGRRGRKPKPHKLQSRSTIKKKYSPKKHKKESPSASEDKKKYDCKICGKSFLNFANLHRYHMPTHFQDMSCKLCDKVFKSMQRLNLHMKIVHKQENEKFYRSCEICGKTILWRSLREHMKRHGRRGGLKCEKCDKEYFNQRAYEDHLQTHSDNYTPLLCKHCGSIFNSRQSLYLHEKKHTEGKRFSCEICSKEFFYKTQLQRHMVVHTKERSFVCDECGGSFKTKYDLQTHQKIHKDIAENGNSKCQYCEKIFKHSVGLQKHMKRHEKKYKCSFCGKILSNLGILKKHESLHKKQPGYQPRKYYKTDKLYQPEPSSETK